MEYKNVCPEILPGPAFYYSSAHIPEKQTAASCRHVLFVCLFIFFFKRAREDQAGLVSVSWWKKKKTGIKVFLFPDMTSQCEY